MTQQYDDPDTQQPNGSAALVRQRFDGNELARVTETASTAVAAAAKASIEARYILAMRRPRNIDAVRIRMLQACDRPGFAEAAIYRKPIGDKKNEETGAWEPAFIEGLSVRFAEEALRCMTNIYRSSNIIYDDETKMIVRVAVMDLESNSTAEDDVVVNKTVERRRLKKNQKPLATRTNSYGEPVYILQATDDEVLNKVNALKAKARRNGMLELVSGDILAECEARCRATMAKQDAKDPDAAKKKIYDGFATVGVMPDQIQEYLGHNNQLSPAELRDLRGIFSALQEGETTWAEIVDAKQPVADGEKQSAAARKVAEVLKNHTEKANQPKKKAADSKPAGDAAKSADAKNTDPAADSSGAPEPGADG